MKKEKFNSNTSLVFYFLKGSVKYFLAAVFFAMLVSVLDLINPRIIGFTVDSVLGNQPVSLPGQLNAMLESIGGIAMLRSHLYIIAAAVVLIALLSALCRFSFRLFNSIGAETFVRSMREKLFEHIIHLPFKWHDENHTGDIIQRCTSDVEQIKMFVSEQLTALIRVIVLIVLALIFMAQIHGGLTLVSAVFIPIIIGYSFFFHHHIGAQFAKVDAEEGKLSSIAQENLTGVRVVRAFGREKYERERFEKQNRYYTGMWVRLMQLMAAFWSTADLFSYGQILTILTVGSWLAVNGQISAGNFIAFISYNAMLTWPVRMLGRVIANLSKAGISIERLRYIMNSEREHDAPDATEPDMAQDIVFDHVTYKYSSGARTIIDDVSFTVKAGTTFGILGGTGSGKSTLMYLLDRVYELDDNGGRIMIGETDIRKISADWLRKNIGLVLQEPFLFSRTLGENIAIATDDADKKEIDTAAKIAALEESIERFKEGYDTTIGERGVTLSGGQKQRTAIAQMLIRKPQIMVFDDSLSAVDAETDAKIRKALNENLENTTTILISHRITTLMHADQIIVLDKGRIIEQGSHEELLAKNGTYKKIYDLQVQQSSAEEEAAHE